MQLFYDFNLSDNGTLTATSTAAGYDVSNLQLGVRSKRWKSASVTSVTLTMDRGTSEIVNAVSMLGCNFFDPVTYTVNVTIQAADDAGFTTGVVTVYTETPTVLQMTDFTYYFNATVKRYWRVQLVASSAMQFTLDRLVFGRSYTTNHGLAPGFQLGPGKSLSKNVITRGGQKYTNRGATLKVARGIAKGLDSDDFDEITELADVNGTGTPFILNIDGAFPSFVASEQRSIYGTLDNLQPPTNAAFNKWDWRVSITAQK